MNVMSRFLFPLLLLFCLLVQSNTLSAQSLREEKNGFFSVAEDTLTSLSLPKRTLSIRSAAGLPGRLVVRTHDDTSLIVRYTVRARATNARKASEFISAIQVKNELSAIESELQFRCPNPPPWRGNSETGTIDVTISLPRNAQIIVDAQLFDVDIVGPLQLVKISKSLGRVVVAEVTQLTDIETANQRLTATNLRGAIRLVTTNATLEAIGIEATSSSPAFLINDGGDVIVRNSRGALDIKDAFGRIQLINYDLADATSTLRGQANPIQVEFRHLGTGQMVIENQDEDIELTLPERASAALLLRVSEQGSIEATDFNYIAEAIERTRMAVRLGSGSAEINATVKGQGNIYVRRGDVREDVEDGL